MSSAASRQTAVGGQSAWAGLVNRSDWLPRGGACGKREEDGRARTKTSFAPGAWYAHVGTAASIEAETPPPVVQPVTTQTARSHAFQVKIDFPLHSSQGPPEDAESTAPTALANLDNTDVDQQPLQVAKGEDDEDPSDMPTVACQNACGATVVGIILLVAAAVVLVIVGLRGGFSGSNGSASSASSAARSDVRPPNILPVSPPPMAPPHSHETMSQSGSQGVVNEDLGDAFAISLHESVHGTPTRPPPPPPPPYTVSHPPLERMDLEVSLDHS